MESNIWIGRFTIVASSAIERSTNIWKCRWNKMTHNWETFILKQSQYKCSCSLLPPLLHLFHAISKQSTKEENSMKQICSPPKTPHPFTLAWHFERKLSKIEQKREFLPIRERVSFFVGMKMKLSFLFRSQWLSFRSLLYS